MKQIFKSLIPAVLIGLFLAVVPVRAEELPLIHVPQLKTMLADKAVAVQVFDANRDSTRAELGIIPGATLLPSASDYEPSLLPTEKSTKLVFYCHSPKCMASHEAAKRAMKLGYQNVAVLTDGIVGWRDAGEKVEKVKAS